MVCDQLITPCILDRVICVYLTKLPQDSDLSSNTMPGTCQKLSSFSCSKPLSKPSNDAASSTYIILYMWSDDVELCVLSGYDELYGVAVVYSKLWAVAQQTLLSIT
jgi:hypothetical protein